MCVEVGERDPPAGCGAKGSYRPALRLSAAPLRVGTLGSAGPGMKKGPARGPTLKVLGEDA